MRVKKGAAYLVTINQTLKGKAMFHNATIKPFNKEPDTDAFGTLLDSTTLRQRERQKQKKVAVGKTTTLYMNLTTLYISLPFLHDYDEKLPYFTF